MFTVPVQVLKNMNDSLHRRRSAEFQAEQYLQQARLIGSGMPVMIMTPDGEKRVRRVLVGDQRFSVQEQLEREAYAENPNAFWMRPDGDYLTDEPYPTVSRYYDEACGMTYEILLEKGNTQ